MLQREVVDRIVATPGGADYGVLAVLVQLRADVRRVPVFRLPARFGHLPRSRQRSCASRSGPVSVELTDEALFESMVRTIFQQRRKTLSNALKPFHASADAAPDDALAAAGIDGRRRPQTLSLDELARLANAFAATISPAADRQIAKSPDPQIAKSPKCQIP